MSPSRKRTLAGLFAAVVIAVATWYFQGDSGGTSTQPTSPPTSVATEAASDQPTYTPEPTDPATAVPTDESGGDQSTYQPTDGSSPADSSGDVDPDSGLPWIQESELPPEGQHTLELIDAGGPYPYPGKDDTTFTNIEGLLPAQGEGYYKEYTVETPGSPDRGARRIVAGSGGEFYYTDDHYRSFRRIAR
jgi:ribonuclease T1